MYSANYVDYLIKRLKEDNGIPLSDKMWQTALACVGWAYVFGAWGALCTVSERKQRYKYNNIAAILEKCQCLRSSDPKSSCSGCKWYPGKERTRCFDCRGFTDWVLKQYGFDLQGEGATSQWNTSANWCAKGNVSDGIPQGMIVCLFYEKACDPKTMSHTGLYYNGETCECSNGVQHFDKINKKWTKWAVAKCFEKEYNAWCNSSGKPANSETVYLPVLKKGDKGEKVKELQNILLRLGYSLPKYGADGSFGKETKTAVEQLQRDWGIPVSGIVDEQTWERLLTTPEKPKFYTVTITRLLEDKADEIIAKYGGTKTVEE